MARLTGIEKVEANLAKVNAELAEVEKRRAALHAEWRRLYEKSFGARMDAAFPEGVPNLEGVMNLSWHELGNIVYKTPWGEKIHKWLDNECYHGSLKGLHHSGITETDQAGFEIHLRSKDRWEKQVGYLIILPHMKVREDGTKLIRLFCRDIFVVATPTEDGHKFDVVDRWYLRTEVKGKKPIASFANGRELLAYLHKNYADTPND